MLVNCPLADSIQPGNGNQVRGKCSALFNGVVCSPFSPLHVVEMCRLLKVQFSANVISLSQ